MKEARDLIIDKSYGDAEELITEININAKDFEARRVEAGIRKAKQASDSALLAATQYRNLGQADKAEAAFREAAAIWPDNPRLHEFQLQGTQLVDKYVQGRNLLTNSMPARLIVKSKLRLSSLALLFRKTPTGVPSLRKLSNGCLNSIFISLRPPQKINNPTRRGDPLKAEDVDPNDVQLNQQSQSRSSGSSLCGRTSEGRSA